MDECTDMAGTIFKEGGFLSFTQYAYDIQLTLVPVSYKWITSIPEILTGKSATNWSHIWFFVILAGSYKEEGSSCKACKWAWSHSVPNSSSEEVSWKKFPISSLFKVTSLCSVTKLLLCPLQHK